jgi:3-dehydroquinate dehydratase-2
MPANPFGGGSASSTASYPDIMVIHGPNLNLLGQREPEIYGDTTLSELNGMLEHIAERHHMRLTCLQSNHEGQIVDAIQKAIGSSEGIIINPGAYTHTSVSIRDALVIYPNPVVEVHISNIHNREAFRSESLVAPVVTGTISGFGIDSYRLALLWMIKHLEHSE